MTTVRASRPQHPLEVLAHDGLHHRDWITASLADHLRQLVGEAALHHAAAAGFLVAQTAALGLADDGTAALARHPHQPELVAAKRAGHARARTVRWALVERPRRSADVGPRGSGSG